MSEGEMNEEERKKRFEELVRQHPDAVAKFTSYYKYRFEFTTEINGVRWDFAIGEDSDDIYRCEIHPEMPLSKVLRQATLQNAWEIIK